MIRGVFVQRVVEEFAVTSLGKDSGNVAVTQRVLDEAGKSRDEKETHAESQSGATVKRICGTPA